MRIDRVISMRLVCERITEMWSILGHLRAQRLNSCHMFQGVRVYKSESYSESLSSIHRRLQEREPLTDSDAGVARRRSRYQSRW